MKVLLADDDAECAGVVACVLTTDAGLTVSRLKSEQFLAAAVASLAPDIVLVGMARPDRHALDGIRRTAALNPWLVGLFVDENDLNCMQDAIATGVSSCNAIGMPPPDVKPVPRAAVALFRWHQQARDDLREAETRFRKQAVVDQAKALLVKHRHLSGPDACQWLRRNAMSSAWRIVDVASELLKDMEGSAE